MYILPGSDTASPVPAVHVYPTRQWYCYTCTCCTCISYQAAIVGGISW